MTEYEINFPLLIGLLGGIIVLIMWVKSGLDRIGVPPLVGYLGLGFGLRIADQQLGLLSSGSQEVFAFLGKIGLITLLFRIGLESKMEMLLGQLRRASMVWLGDIFVSGLLGFSLAIGAFFAGLLFSRYLQDVKMETSFLPIYELVSPFFFIGIGMNMDLDHFGMAIGLGAVLLSAAILGKLVGDGVPLFLMKGWKSGLLIGVSMVPRAEIAMVVMQRGLEYESVSSQVLTGMVMVSAATSLLSPIAIRSLLRQWPQKKEK